MIIKLTAREMFALWTSIRGFEEKIQGLEGSVIVNIPGELISEVSEDLALCKYFIAEKDQDEFNARCANTSICCISENTQKSEVVVS